MNARSLVNNIDMGIQYVTESRDMLPQTESKREQHISDKCIQLDHADGARTSTLLRWDKDTQTQESFTSINKFLTEFQDGTVKIWKTLS